MKETVEGVIVQEFNVEVPDNGIYFVDSKEFDEHIEIKKKWGFRVINEPIKYPCYGFNVHYIHHNDDYDNHIDDILAFIYPT